MSGPSFTKVAAAIFAVVALGHAGRLALTLPVQIGALSIPIWVSWLGLIVTASLSVWGFRSK